MSRQIRALPNNPWGFNTDIDQEIDVQMSVRAYYVSGKHQYYKPIRVERKFELMYLQTVPIDGTCDTNEIVNIFNEKYKSILDNPQCQATHTVPRPRSNVSILRFTPPELDTAISRLNPGRDADFVYVTHLKNAGPCFRNLLCKLMNKFVSHSFLPRNILGGLIQPIV